MRLSVCLLLTLLLAHTTLARNKRAHGFVTSLTRSKTTEATFILSDFGAAGDGVTDDGPAFQSAFDAIASAGGGTLLIPAGTYFIATPVVGNFSAVPGATVNIQGVPSDTMPAPPTAGGHELAVGLNLTSEIIPATGADQTAITLGNLHQLTIEHVAFTGRENELTDAFMTLYLIDIDQATIRHSEFYGLSTFGWTPELGGGNIVRAVRSELSIELSVFLGCTANSGVYAPVVENREWKRFAISNSIFLDYGIRSFFGKTGFGAPLSWFNLANAAALTPESTRREVIVRDVFLDEGGWVGISVFPDRFPRTAPIDLIYISGLSMNVSNFGTAGHLMYDAKNLLIENSDYRWSRRTVAAVDINRFDNAILDKLTCRDAADRIRADAGTNRLTVINSVYEGLDSLAQTTTVLTTTPEQDPVQYVRQQFLSALGRQPDPAAHFYWSDLLIRCGANQDCLTQTRDALDQYLGDSPPPDFSLSGSVVDENGRPISDASITLGGSQSFVATTDSQGNFRFSALPTSGNYTVAITKPHYTFTPSVQTFAAPTNNVSVAVRGRLNRYSISGKIRRPTAVGIGGVPVRLAPSNLTLTTDANGYFSFTGLPAGENYTLTPVSSDFIFRPVNATFNNLSRDQVGVNFEAWVEPELLTIGDSENALAIGAISFTAAPFSLSDFTSDGFRRLIVFAKNVESFATLSRVSIVAADDQGNSQPVIVEFMADVPGQSWLKQLNIKVSSSFPANRCLNLKLSVYNVESNDARLCLRPQITPPHTDN